MFLSWASRVKILVLLENCQFDSSYYVEDGEFRENIFEEKKNGAEKSTDDESQTVCAT